MTVTEERPPANWESILVEVGEIEAPAPADGRASKEEDAELAKSIEAQGILQPLLLRRRLGAGIPYLIVCGRRRYRAAVALGKAAVPAMIRTMTDAEAEQAELVENAARADAHPLDEAQQVERLVTTHGMRLPDVAERIGKSLSTIERRLKLLNLTEKCQKAYRAGKITHSSAALIARMPNDEDQDKLLKTALRDDGSDREENYVAGQAIREHMHPLAKAPFSVGELDLPPGRIACTACQHRTAAQPALFEDVGKDDYCLDGRCYREKVNANSQRLLDAARKEGIPTLGEKHARTIFDSYEGGLAYDSAYYARMAPLPSLKYSGHKLAKTTLNELMSKLPKAARDALAKTRVAAIDRKGKAWILYHRLDVDAALRAAKIVNVDRAHGRRMATPAQKAKMFTHRVKARAAMLALLSIRAKVGKSFTLKQGAAVIDGLMGHCLHDAKADMIRSRDPKAKRQDAGRIDAIARKLETPEAQMKFIVEYAVCNSSFSGLYSANENYGTGYAKGLVKCAGAFGVNLKRCEAAARVELTTKKGRKAKGGTK